MLSFIFICHAELVFGELGTRVCFLEMISLFGSVGVMDDEWTSQGCIRFIKHEKSVDSRNHVIIDVDNANRHRLPNACFWREGSSTIQWDTSRVNWLYRLWYHTKDRSCQIQNCCRFVGNLRALNDTIGLLVFKCLAWNSSPSRKRKVWHTEWLRTKNTE